MDQPVFRKNANGEVEEYRPVVVSRDQLAQELENELEAGNQVDGTVKALEEHRDELNRQAEQTEETLKVAYAEQEAQHEKVAFRQAKLDAYDQALAADPDVANAASSATAEDVAPVPTPGQPSDEDVAESLELDEDDADEPEAPVSEEVVVAVRRRASV